MKHKSAFFNNGFIDTDLQFFNNSQSITCMSWIKFLNCKNEQVSILLGQRDGYNGRVEFYVENKLHIFGPSCESKTSNLEIENDKWYHIALSLDTELKIIKIYINGKIEIESKITGNFVNSKTSIGKYPNTSYKFNGYMAEIRFYNYSMNEKEINSKMNKIENINNENLLGYYNFENSLLDVTKKINNVSVIDVELSEDYPKNINSFKYLIYENGNYYTINPEYYKNGQFISLKISDKDKKDYSKFGFSDINKLCTDINDEEEIHKPIDDIISNLGNKFKLLIIKEY